MATILQINIYGPDPHDQSIIVACNKCKSINTHNFGRHNARIINEEEEVDDRVVKFKYKSLDFRNLGKRACDNMDCDANYYLYSNNK